MKINSTLLNDEEFKWVKNSILNADDIDGEGSFRVKLIEYINDTADNDNDKYFFDMLPFVRFLESMFRTVNTFHSGIYILQTIFPVFLMLIKIGE